MGTWASLAAYATVGSGFGGDTRRKLPLPGRCLEGLFEGPSLLRRTGIKGEALLNDHPASDWAARYLGVRLANAVLTLPPERIVVGGGVMASPHLRPKVRASLQTSLAACVQREVPMGDVIEQYLVPPGLGPRSGIAGAFVPAEHSREAGSGRG